MILPIILLLQAADTPTTVDSTVVTAKAEPKPKLICRSLEHSGSIFRDRVCKTADEWRARSDSTKGSDDFQTLAHISANPKPE